MEIGVRPQIYIAVLDTPPQRVISSILHGLEEEGIPFFLEEFSDREVVELAYQASVKSSLNVGISCNQTQAILHYKNLKNTTPYIVLENIQQQPKEVLKRFGGNAARLVKGVAFKDLEDN
ncbi:Dehydratase medium subunit [Pilibacter termitis]|uniref:Dehydratase medium subunit n=1 Tax=Pilibacter termitis TaxID=263852 RepID=A0A1T4MKB5_9ENTE|nr:glycerol dehydratase reactivase beta/small subunit family protein [Pilibacter termitis]SJZ67393.1 Dehydratase medium subunit [Pilibacter termitis]